MTARARLLVGSIAVLVMATGINVALASPASAAPCHSDSCNGLNPQTTGCSSDATTLEWFFIYVDEQGFVETTTDVMPGQTAKIELRFSAQCWAAWARLSFLQWVPGTQGWYGDEAAKIIGYHDGTSTSYLTHLPVTMFYNVWSPMVTFRYWTSACFHYWYYPGGYSQESCTNLH
jgi:hypothetical protein